MAGGVGGVPPQTLKGGEQLTLNTPPRVGPKTSANPKPTGVGKRGSRGRSPRARGVPLQIQKRELVARSAFEHKRQENFEKLLKVSQSDSDRPRNHLTADSCAGH